MKTKGYLVVGKNGSLRAVKKMKGPLHFDEIAVALDLNIPDSAFKPVIQAEIKIDEKDVHPLLISTGKLNQTADIISNEIGMKVVLKDITREQRKKLKGSQP